MELTEFQRRFQKKLRSKGETLSERYARTCPICGVEASTETGVCRVCGREVVKIERDPTPPGTQIPVDPEKAELLKTFYGRLEKQRIDRERAESPPKRDVKLLPGESLPGDEKKRDWAKVLRETGLIKRRW